MNGVLDAIDAENRAQGSWSNGTGDLRIHRTTELTESLKPFTYYIHSVIITVCSPSGIVEISRARLGPELSSSTIPVYSVTTSR